MIKLEAKTLYGPFKISAIVDPGIKGTKASLDQHHLFPRGYLEEIGITDLKQVNQIANFAAVEWPSNIKIGKRPPSEYVPPLDASLTATEREQLYFWHGLPPLWWELAYDAFLVQRRARMAKVIHSAWKQLVGEPTEINPPSLSVTELIAAGESDEVEFKSTLRTNLHTGQHDDKMQFTVLRTIAGFLNARGGTLLIGVADDGEVLGLTADGFASEDKMGLHLVNLIKDRVGDAFLPYVHPHFESQDGQALLTVRCERGPKAAFVKDGNLHRFFVRAANSTAELSGSSMTDYVKQRFA